jgi:tetratricopeptide (TPR) repeat protein
VGEGTLSLFTAKSAKATNTVHFGDFAAPDTDGKEILAAKIASANALRPLNAKKGGDASGALAALLDQAIATNRDKGATQDEVDAATATLAEGIAVFLSAPNKADRTTLGIMATAAGSLTQGRKGDGAFATLQTAIATAEDVFNNNDPTLGQATVNTAVMALAQAVAAFNDAEDDPANPENDTVSKGALGVMIESYAKALYGSNGSGGIAKIDSAITALGEAIGIASGVYEDAAATQEEINAAAKTLADAASTFISMPDKTDMEILDATIKSAGELLKWTKSNAAFNIFLKNAIEAASYVYEKPNATEADIEGASDTLAAAITKFLRTANVDGLEKAIEDAEAALGNYDNKADGAYKDLQEAIGEAKKTLENIDATQDGVKKVVEGLVEATKIFIGSPDKVDKTSLAAKIKEAEGITQGRKSAAAWTALQNAIIAANAEYGRADVTQADIILATATLEAAIMVFKASPDEVDKTSLAAKIEEGVAIAQGGKGAAAWATLQNALAAANSVYVRADATQAEVNDAWGALTDAIAAFYASPDEAVDSGQAPLTAQPTPDEDEPEEEEAEELTTTEGNEPPPSEDGGIDATNETGGIPAEDGTPLSELPEQPIPESAGAPGSAVDAGRPDESAPVGAWSLVNLLLAIVAALLMAWLLIRYAIAARRSGGPAEAAGSRRAGRRRARKIAAWALGALCVAAVILLFILTEDIQRPMGMANSNTVFYIAAVAVEALLLIFSAKKGVAGLEKRG